MENHTIHLAGRIDQIVRDYFAVNRKVDIELAKNLMPLFIMKGIFAKDHRAGKPIRDFIRLLDENDALHLIPYCKVIRKAKNRNWYFERASGN